MKKLFLVFMLLLFPVFCFAAPFLVCDPQAGVIFYNLDVNGGAIIYDIPAQPDGSIHYDLVSMSPGPYIFKAQAIGQGGWPSDWSDPFDTMKPGNPMGLRVSLD